MTVKQYDFGGYATKNNLECSDGLTIRDGAFSHQHGMQVPLLWQHGHNDPENVLGHAILENRGDGTYAHCVFNDTPKAQIAKTLVEHKDVNALSIYANKLLKKGKDVLKGAIKEVSLVLAGANPGALIDNVRIAHGDGFIELEDEVIIYHDIKGLDVIEHSFDADMQPEETDAIEHADDETIEDILNTFSDKQKAVLFYLVSTADGSAEHADIDQSEILDVIDSLDDKQKAVFFHSIDHAVDDSILDDEEEDDEEDDPVDPPVEPPADGDPAEGTEDLNHSDQEGTIVSHNVWEQDSLNGSAISGQQLTITHDQFSALIKEAKDLNSWKNAFLAHADEYGISNIEELFPTPKNLTGRPTVIMRKMEWVDPVINGVSRTPFNRIKSMSTDMTHEGARARGYIKATMKKDDFHTIAFRETTPGTVYIRRKFDRDDIIDITDFDVVAWAWELMHLLMKEELARAIMIGDGREIDDPYKIKEDKIRPIAWDDEFYTHKITLPANVVGDAMIEAIIRSRKHYKGAGNPTMYTTEDILTDLLLIKDRNNRRIYRNKEELASELRVKDIVTVELFDTVPNLLAVLVNVSDYTVGSAKGGQLTSFDQFDIDFNQYKYLLEGRLCGALTDPKTAIAIWRAAGTEVTPTVPTFVPATGVLTIPVKAGVTYVNQETSVAFASGAQAPIASGSTISVEATPDEGYYFPHGIDTDWDFTADVF